MKFWFKRFLLYNLGMNKKYKNPPVREAVCEFRFDLKGDFKDVDLKAIHNEIATHFPIMRKGQIVEVQFKMESKSDKPDYDKTVLEFDEFSTEEKDCFIQLDGARVSIHKLKPYRSWEIFFEKIKAVFNVYTKYVPVNSIQRIGLRYIDDIILPQKPLELGYYFNIKPELPKAFQKNKMVSFLLGAVLEFKDGEDLAKVQLVERVSAKEESTFVLDTDYFTSPEKTPEIGNVLKWVDNAHTKLDEIFEEVLTAETKKLFDV